MRILSELTYELRRNALGQEGKDGEVIIQVSVDVVG
ncbi:Uncharacterised protein [Serratia marcescens]|nr:Uncharacterised protein [Serratia marcescens]CUY22136.1 Uncharacterised protein [Serratia marcescens]CUY68468.1 Uncharacterised protein [Serratia marcescens]CVE51888.1 Uncharacterised protein [Serratia marcescens]